MSPLFVVLAIVVAVGPLRVRQRLADPAPATAVAMAGVVVMAVGGGAAAGADDLLAALDISPETWRIAAGLVLTAVGLRRLILPPSELVVPLPGRAAWVVPGAFPLLLTPEVTALLVLFGATEPSALLITALAVGLGLVVAAAWIPAAPRRWEAAIVRSSGLLLVAFGIALVVEGIRDV